MNEVFSLALSLAGGFGAGVLFFGGLWLTVRHLQKWNHPGLVVFLSFVARIAVVLGAVWWLSRGDLLRLGLCLAGLLAARFVLISAVRGAGAPAEPPLTSRENK